MHCDGDKKRMKKAEGSEAKKNEYDLDLSDPYHVFELLEKNHDKAAHQVLSKIPLTSGPPEKLVDALIFVVDKYRKVKDQVARNKENDSRQKKAVGSVAKKAAEGSESLLSEARKDVVAARKPDLPAPKEVMEMAEAVADVKVSAEQMQEDTVQENIKDTTKLVNSLNFAQGGNKKMDKQYVMESLQEVSDTPIVQSKESIAEFIADLHRTQVDEESRPLLDQKDFEKLIAFASSEPRVEKKEGGKINKLDPDSDEAKYLMFEKSYYRAMEKAKTDEDRKIITERFKQIRDSFSPNVISNAWMSQESEEREGKFLGGMLMAKEILEDKQQAVDAPEGSLPEASISNLEGPDPVEPSNNELDAPPIGYAEGGDVEDKMKPYQEGGLMDMPVDTYDNIRPEEKEAVEASQLPDTEMEDQYAEFILDESLTEQDQDYLLSALEGDERLGSIFDKIMDVAGEFAGDGAVNGPGTGTSDSIPARLSDGEFVFTKKAVDQLGVDNLQKMMDDAEKAYDGGLMKKYAGGSILTSEEMEDPDKDVHTQMLLANAMPSVR